MRELRFLIVADARFLFPIQNTHGFELGAVDVADAEKEFLIVLRLIVWIRPGEELEGVVPEMHRDFAKDSIAQINSVIKILRRREDNFRMLDVARIEIDRPAHSL